MKSQKGNVLVLFLCGLAIVFALGMGYLYRQNQLLEGQNQKLIKQLDAPPITQRKQTAETANWKTYVNNTYGFQFKYPPTLTADLKDIGFVGGSDYYGKRDFNLLLVDPTIEPSVEGPADDATGKPIRIYDGINFAIFSGVAAQNHLKNDQDTIKSSQNFQVDSITIGNNSVTIYTLPAFFPKPLTGTISQVSFPLGDRTMIVHTGYDKALLKQILLTFTFTK